MPNDNLQPDTVKKDRKKQSRAAEIWKRFRRSKLAMVGFVIIVTVVLLAAFASVICDYEADAITQNYDARFLGPSLHHLFGTDDYGRDIFARVLFGARVSLTVGIVSTAVACLIACLLGSIVAYYGGKVDSNTASGYCHSGVPGSRYTQPDSGAHYFPGTRLYQGGPVRGI